MKLKYEYESKETGRLLTDCRFGESVDLDGNVVIIKVGSIMCERCKHFINIDNKKREVECGMWSGKEDKK